MHIYDRLCILITDLHNKVNVTIRKNWYAYLNNIKTKFEVSLSIEKQVFF